LVRCEVVEVRDEPLDRGTADEVRRREAARILPHLEGAVGVACDRQGTQLSSEELAELLGRLLEAPPQRAAVVIGGAEGLDASVLDACRHRIAFGRVTLPHQLARVVLGEQLYRALAIRQGHPYHR
jgi:23S rRNA (pseudouridine1915-N3)-methyltransferase